MLNTIGDHPSAAADHIVKEFRREERLPALMILVDDLGEGLGRHILTSCTVYDLKLLPAKKAIDAKTKLELVSFEMSANTKSDISFLYQSRSYENTAGLTKSQSDPALPSSAGELLARMVIRGNSRRRRSRHWTTLAAH